MYLSTIKQSRQIINMIKMYIQFIYIFLSGY